MVYANLLFLVAIVPLILVLAPSLTNAQNTTGCINPYYCNKNGQPKNSTEMQNSTAQAYNLNKTDIAALNSVCKAVVGLGLHDPRCNDNGTLK
jgi:hypothetical protein